MPATHRFRDNQRLSIPKKYTDLVPYAWYALTLLRRRRTIDWLRLQPENGLYQPYARAFAEETLNLLFELSERHGKAPSCILGTALRYFEEAPRAPVEPRGLADASQPQARKTG